MSSSAQNLGHRFFLVTILAKGSLGLAQIATAFAIFFGLTERLPSLFQSLIQTELAEDPNDFLLARIMSIVRALPNTDMTFYTYYFLVHGLLHIGVVAALLIGARWAYPVAVIVLFAFVIYQMLEWMAVGGTMLLVLSAIDMLVIVLTFAEWKRLVDP
ncbi:MAG: DUF2127 domain-containing protein [Sulfitobacter sp.]